MAQPTHQILSNNAMAETKHGYAPLINCLLTMQWTLLLCKIKEHIRQMKWAALSALQWTSFVGLFCAEALSSHLLNQTDTWDQVEAALGHDYNVTIAAVSLMFRVWADTGDVFLLFLFTTLPFQFPAVQRCLVTEDCHKVMHIQVPNLNSLAG